MHNAHTLILKIIQILFLEKKGKLQQEIIIKRNKNTRYFFCTHSYVTITMTGWMTIRK